MAKLMGSNDSPEARAEQERKFQEQLEAEVRQRKEDYNKPLEGLKLKAGLTTEERIILAHQLLDSIYGNHHLFATLAEVDVTEGQLIKMLGLDINSEGDDPLFDYDICGADGWRLILVGYSGV